MSRGAGREDGRRGGKPGAASLDEPDPDPPTPGGWHRQTVSKLRAAGGHPPEGRPDNPPSGGALATARAGFGYNNRPA